MTPIDSIKKFLSVTRDISIGFNEINFFNVDNLDEGQIGYRVDTNGNSLVDGKEGNWQKEWLVIANDQLGDPIIIDTNSPNLTVLTSQHGEGDWETTVIADSLDTFKNITFILDNISKNRTNPVDIEKNPISDKELKLVLTQIEEQNPGSELWFWESFFEND